MLFDVKVKPYVPKKKKNGKEGGGFLRHTFGGHIDRTFEQAFDYSNPLAELNQCVLDSANGLVIYIIDVL